MKLIIEKVENGYITQTPEGKSVQVDIKDLLHEILDYFGEPGSRHSEKRIYIVERPGDKHPDFTEADAEVIFGVK